MQVLASEVGAWCRLMTAGDSSLSHVMLGSDLSSRAFQASWCLWQSDSIVCAPGNVV